MLVPNVETIMELHDTVLEMSGGKDGILHQGTIIAAVERPSTYIQYAEETCDIHTICALLIDSIARNHGFKDGNKRTSLMTAIFTYRINQVYFTANLEMNQDFDALVMWVVQQKPTIPQIAARLKELCQKYASDGGDNFWRDMLNGFTRFRLLKFPRKDS